MRAGGEQRDAHDRDDRNREPALAAGALRNTKAGASRSTPAALAARTFGPAVLEDIFDIGTTASFAAPTGS